MLVVPPSVEPKFWERYKLEIFQLNILFSLCQKIWWQLNLFIGKDLIAQGINVYLMLYHFHEMCKFGFGKNETVCFVNIVTDLSDSGTQCILKILSKYNENFVKEVPAARDSTRMLEIRLKDPNKNVQRWPYILAPSKHEMVRNKTLELINAKTTLNFLVQ